jgi:D-arginine dehydrogenase
VDEPALLAQRAGRLRSERDDHGLERACKSAGVVSGGFHGPQHRARSPRQGVELEDGALIEADGGRHRGRRWSGALGRSAGAVIDRPLRRHLIVLEADPRRAGTTVWRFGESQVYYRPEAGGVLTSPCDEDPFEPCLPPADPSALEMLAIALEPLAPELVLAKVRTKWACLRTYAHDRELVLGPDPRLEGLAWLTGFGGRGMTVAVAAAELCAAAMRGDDRTLASSMRPDRAQPAELVAPHG